MRFTLVALLLVASCGAQVNWSGNGTISGAVPGLDASASRTDEAPLDVKAGDVVDASSDYGELRFVVDEKAKPSAKATFTVNAKTDADAKRVLATWKIVATKSGSTTRLSAEGETLETSFAGGTAKIAPSVDFVITLPAGVVAHAKSQSGDVAAEGAFAGVDLATAYGKARVVGARGDVAVKSQSGDVTVESAECSKIDAKTSYGDVKLTKIAAAKVVAESSSGAVSCETQTEGEFTLTTAYGDVRMRGGKGALVAKSQSGRVDVEDFDGKATAHSAYGDVAVAGVLTVVEATTDSGAAKVTARSGSKAAAAWSVTSKYGDVTLGLPDDFACDLDLSTQYGSLRASHPAIGREPDEGAKKMRAKMGAGGPAVVVATQSGSATVERSER